MENHTVYTYENTMETGSPLSDLVAKAKQGKPGAFDQLYSLLFKKIFAFVYYRVGHKEIAEDITEEVFIKAYQKIESISKSDSFEGWLYQIARNAIVDYYRSKKEQVNIDGLENMLPYEDNLVANTELHYHQKLLLDLMQKLNKEQQTVIRLKFLEHLENDEIAMVLEKSEGAIRVIQHRALNKLMELAKETGLEIPF